MSTPPVATFSGLSSGIDTSGIIAQLTAVAQKPIVAIQNTEQGYNDAITSWQDLNSRLSALQTATTALTRSGTFDTVSGASTNTSVASFSASAGATVGQHTLTVNQLAQAQKVVSQSQTSSNIALGLTGTFSLNGKSVSIKAADTLSDVAVKINLAGAGVTAGVVDVAQNDFRLTLTGNTTGAAAAFSAADASGGDPVLARLGLLSGSAAIRQTVTPGTNQTGAASLALTSATQSVAAALGLPTTPPPAHDNVSINGTNINIDLNVDSLTSIANKINAAQIGGISAQIVSASGSGGGQQLQIVSTNTTTDSQGHTVPAPPQFTDSAGILSTLGVLQQGFTQTLTAAQDAKFNLDGLDLTRSTNVISDAIPSGTIKLLSATPAGGTSGSPPAPATTTLSVAQNTDSVVSSVGNFVNAFNGIQSFVSLQNQFTPSSTTADGTTTGTSPLFGNSTLSSIQATLTQTLSAVSGSTTLQDIGITYGTDGTLTLDSNALTTALQNNPNAVAHLFGQSGQADNTAVTFVGATAKTQASAGSGYAVQVSQAATQASGTAATAQTSPSAAPETLTFGGTLFQSPVSLTLTASSTLADTVRAINGNSNLNGKIYAAINSTTGALSLSAQQYGAGNSFTVASDSSAGAATSGVGSGFTVTDGTDVKGTINGEAATGKGRTLTGASGNATTEGLALLVTATPSDITGSASYNSATHSAAFGHVAVTHGVADALGSALTQILDPVNGEVIGAENGLNAQISDAQKQITTLQADISSYTDYLTQTFSAMETRVSQLKSQGSAFTTQLTGTAKSG